MCIFKKNKIIKKYFEQFYYPARSIISVEENYNLFRIKGNLSI
jgi:hypothetical protein